MNSKEAGVLLGRNLEALHWHLESNRSVGYLPDSALLWSMFWENRENLAGFAHSHPGKGLPSPSHEDITTFAAVEAGLGQRLTWWITSEDQAITLKWVGPGRHDYLSEVLLDEPDWLYQLRWYSVDQHAATIRGKLTALTIQHKKQQKRPVPEPRYDEVFFEGVKWLESLDSEPAITFITPRTKPLNELTAADIPRGLSPEDVATDYLNDRQEEKNNGSE